MVKRINSSSLAFGYHFIFSQTYGLKHCQNRLWLVYAKPHYIVPFAVYRIPLLYPTKKGKEISLSSSKLEITFCKLNKSKSVLHLGKVKISPRKIQMRIFGYFFDRNLLLHHTDNHYVSSCIGKEAVEV